MVYRVGIIGFGIMGQRMFDNMARHESFTVAAVFDPAGSRPDAPYVESADAITNGADIDVVYIACPPAHHAAYAIAAAEAGKPVFCEKPLGVDIADSKRLVAEMDRLDAANAVNFSFAANPSRAYLRGLLADGSLGHVEAVDIRLHFATWPESWQVAAAWLGQRAQGGFVREVLSHFMYLTESVFGPATLESAAVRYPDGPNGTAAENGILAQLSAGGIPVSVAGSVGGKGPDLFEYTVWGRERSLRLDNWYTPYLSEGDGWRPCMPDAADLRQTGRMRQIDHLAKFMEGAPHELPDFRAALSVQEIIEGILARR